MMFFIIYPVEIKSYVSRPVHPVLSVEFTYHLDKSVSVMRLCRLFNLDVNVKNRFNIHISQEK